MACLNGVVGCRNDEAVAFSRICISRRRGVLRRRASGERQQTSRETYGQQASLESGCESFPVFSPETNKKECRCCGAVSKDWQGGWARIRLDHELNGRCLSGSYVQLCHVAGWLAAEGYVPCVA